MTPNREDYLKLIFELGGDIRKINNKQIVVGLNVSPASVSEMITKLVREKLVEHSPYQGVQLTATGLEKASSLMRKHRLWEVFLVKHLNFSWNEVHDEAELLEHVTSDSLANRLAEYLGNPTSCPHGGVIPENTHQIQEKTYKTLADYSAGTFIRIERVLDEKKLLEYLGSIDIHLHEEYVIKTISDYEGPIILTNPTKEIAISFKAASTVFVSQLEVD